MNLGRKLELAEQEVALSRWADKVTARAEDGVLWLEREDGGIWSICTLHLDEALQPGDPGHDHAWRELVRYQLAELQRMVDDGDLTVEELEAQANGGPN